MPSIAAMVRLAESPDLVDQMAAKGRQKAEEVFDVKKVMHEMTEEGKTIFFSTHILDVAEKLCSRVAIIKQGKILKVGSMKEVKGDKSLEKVFLDLEG